MTAQTTAAGDALRLPDPDKLRQEIAWHDLRAKQLRKLLQARLALDPLTPPATRPQAVAG